jgi:hypothetical protein
MAEKLAVFLFAGILGVMLYHFAAAQLLHQMLAHTSAAFDWWLVPLAVIPALLLLVLAWCLGFGRRGSTLWGNLGALAATAAIVYFTLGAPYNCWKQFCF